jgi:hypothetical protein
MRIEKSIVFDENEQTELTNIANWCLEATGFFTDEGFRAVRVVTQGEARTDWEKQEITHDKRVNRDQLCLAMAAVDKALERVKAMETSQRFPGDKKARLESNLVVVRTKLAKWAVTLGEGKV